MVQNALNREAIAALEEERHVLASQLAAARSLQPREPRESTTEPVLSSLQQALQQAAVTLKSPDLTAAEDHAALELRVFKVTAP